MHQAPLSSPGRRDGSDRGASPARATNIEWLSSQSWPFRGHNVATRDASAVEASRYYNLEAWCSIWVSRYGLAMLVSTIIVYTIEGRFNRRDARFGASPRTTWRT